MNIIYLLERHRAGEEPEVRVESIEIDTPIILAATMTAKGGASEANSSFSSISSFKIPLPNC
jgi:hypothetical protein